MTMLLIEKMGMTKNRIFSTIMFFDQSCRIKMLYDIGSGHLLGISIVELILLHIHRSLFQKLFGVTDLCLCSCGFEMFLQTTLPKMKDERKWV